MMNPILTYTVDNLGFVPVRDQIYFQEPFGRLHCLEVCAIPGRRFAVKALLLPGGGKGNSKAAKVRRRQRSVRLPWQPPTDIDRRL